MNDSNSGLARHTSTQSCFPGGSDGKESACNAGDLGSIPGSGRPPGGGHGNPLQYCCLENPHGQRSAVGYSPRGHTQSDTTERLNNRRSPKSRRSHLCKTPHSGHTWYQTGEITRQRPTVQCTQTGTASSPGKENQQHRH